MKRKPPIKYFKKNVNIKNILYIVIIFVIITMSVVFLDSTVDNDQEYLNEQQALVIAEDTEEVNALYQLREGQFSDCIEKSVLSSCESSWVTCVDDVWVVQFSFDEKCSIEHDGRLGVTILVDALTGKIISRFPESEYFKDEKFCLEDYDCVYLSSRDNEPTCHNFVYGQLNEIYNKDVVSEKCFCEKRQCSLRM